MPIAASANTTERAAPAGPRVSVVVPAYNAAGSLELALRSALDQTLAEIEVIVVNDGSTDATLQIARRVAAEDGRVRVLTVVHNAGAAAARNRGFAAARGDWIALLDADDWFRFGRLARLVDLGEARRADVVADNLRHVAADGTGLGTALTWGDPVFESPLSAAGFVRRNLLLTGGFKLGYLKPLFRRKFLEGHDLRQDERLRIAEDFHFLLDCLLAGGRLVVDRHAGYDYRQMPESLSRRLSFDDLERMNEANRALLARPEAQADKDLQRALRRRQWSIDLNIDFVRFVTELKDWRLLAAGSIFARHPDLTPFLAFYGLQSLYKRLPGGRHLA